MQPAQPTKSQSVEKSAGRTPVMRHDERCDRCGARAYVMTLHSGRALMWCSHHYNEHEEALREYLFIDAREALTVN
ncbi:DUF7455 domain-containing protein [Nocardioides abyssi]|uniref:DUF7455 domain-containing protein n=1 Tax=Nocardioides abyssi TaxID=3058370 RepID=UPI003F6D0B37